MKWFYKYGNEDWVLLPVRQRMHGNLIRSIQGPRTTTVVVQRPLYQVLRNGLSAVAKVDTIDLADGTNMNTQVTTIGTWSSSSTDATAKSAGLPTSLPSGTYVKIYSTVGTVQGVLNTIDSPQTPGASYKYWFAFDLYGDVGTPYIIMYQGTSTSIIRVRGNHSTGKFEVYNGSTHVDTGIGYAVDTFYRVKVRVTTATTFDLFVETSRGVIYSTTGLPTVGTISGVFTKVAVGINDAHHLAYFGNLSVSWDTETVGWDESNTQLPFMKIVQCPDGVTAALLNSGFDAIEKLDLWKVYGIRHVEKMLTLDLEQWHSQLWRDLHAENDNVSETLYIDDITDLVNDNQFNVVTAKGGSTHPAWVANDQANRGVRILAADAVPTQDQIENGSPAYTENHGDGHFHEVGTHANMDLDNQVDPIDYAGGTYYAVYAHGDSTNVARVILNVYFNIPRCPDANGFIIKCKFRPWWIYTSGNVILPATISLKNFNGGSDLVIWTSSGVYGSITGGYTRQFTIPADKNVLDYYDFENEQFKLIFDGGRLDYADGPDYYVSGFGISFIAIDYTKNNQHDPIEYKIESNTAHDGSPHAEITIVDDPGVYDTKTNRINHQDTVQVLFQEEEWMESHVINRALNISSIECASTAALTPSFSVMKDKPIRTNLVDVMDRNQLYPYLTRKTYSGCPKLCFVDKDTPAFHGLRVYPGNIIRPQPEYHVNFLQKLRSITVSNETIPQGSTLPDSAMAGSSLLSDYPPLAIQRKSLPTAYLDGMATSLLAGRDVVNGNINALMLYSCKIVDEDFAAMDTGDYPEVVDVVNWACAYTATASLFAKIASYQSSNMLHIYDFDSSDHVDVTKTLLIPRAHGFTDFRNTINFVMYPTAAVSDRCTIAAILLEGSTPWLYLRVNCRSGQLDYSFDDVTYTDSGLDLTLGSLNTLYCQLTAVNKFKLKLNSGSYGSEITNTNSYTTQIEKVQFLTPDSHSAECFDIYGEAASITGGFWNTWDASQANVFESFHDGVDGDVVDGRPGWTASGETADATFKVATVSGNKCARFYDNDAASRLIGFYTLGTVLDTANDYFQCSVYINSIGAGTFYIEPRTIGTGVIAYISLNALSTGVWHTIKVIFPTVNTYTYIVDGVSYGPYATGYDISVKPMALLWFDGATAAGKEDVYIDNLAQIHTTAGDTSPAVYTFKQVGGKGQYAKTLAETPVSWPIMTWGTSCAAAGSYGFTKVITTASHYINSISTAGAELQYFLFDSTNFYIKDGNNWILFTTHPSVMGVQYTFIITIIDNLHFKVSRNGVDLSDHATDGVYFHNNGLQTAWPAKIKIWTGAANIVSFTLDDIWTSWATTAPNVATIEARIDDICNDGDIVIQSIPSEYLHEGEAIDVHLAPTTKVGTDYTKRKFKQIIRDIEWYDENDKVKVNLGFDDTSRVSIEQAKELRLVDPTR